ncbi:MAG: BON domain-containing protein [Thermodesulfobacteriota bacterium]
MTTAYKLATDERTVGCCVDDAVIATKIRKSFIDDPVLSVFDIKVMAHRGHVVLAGIIKTSSQAKRATSLARKVAGVREVKTYFLSGRKPGHSLNGFIDDCLITSRIKAKLIGDPNLRVFQIDIYTVCGHVVMAGIVNNKERASLAVRYAHGVSGVRKVRSFIMVSKGDSLF